MLDKINIVNKSSTTRVTCVTPEKIDLNMKNIGIVFQKASLEICVTLGKV